MSWFRLMAKFHELFHLHNNPCFSLPKEVCVRDSDRAVGVAGSEVRLLQVLLQPMVMTVVSQAVPLQPMKVNSATSSCSMWGTPCRSRWMCTEGTRVLKENP